LRPDQLRRNAAGGYVVEIYPDPIPAHIALPSQDGDYRLFFYTTMTSTAVSGVSSCPRYFRSRERPEARWAQGRQTMSHKNCTLCAVQRQSDGRGFNVMTEHRVPLVSLTYETEALAEEALSLMAKVLEEAVVAAHATLAGEQRERRRRAKP
jgi:hypothetical protein